MTLSIHSVTPHARPVDPGDLLIDLTASPGTATTRPGAHRVPAEEPPLPLLRKTSLLRWQVLLVRWLIALDVVAAGVAATVAVGVRFGSPPSAMYWMYTLLFPLVWAVSCACCRAYEPRFLGTGSEEYRRVFDAGVRLLAVTALVSFAFTLELARLYVLIVFPTALVLSLVLRYAARQYVHRRRSAGGCLHKVVVVGRERSCAELVRQLHGESYAGFRVVGACIDRAGIARVEGVPVVGTSASVVQALAETGADTVAVSAWSDLTQDDLRRLSWQLEGSAVSLVVAPSVTDIAGPRIHIRPVAGLPLLHVEQPEFNGARRLLKGAVDRVAAALALLLLAPLLLVIALAVRCTSPGPALFRQTRVGVDGSLFRLYKFRSMYVDAEARLSALAAANEASDGLLFKIRQDPRVTDLGRFLRRYSLDELPQLVNILRGQMSIVGPRPPLPSEVAQYGADVRRRLLVKPGLTGLWQISGRSDLSWQESVRLDLHYVENWSLALDATIVWKTFSAVLARRGAY